MPGQDHAREQHADGRPTTRRPARIARPRPPAPTARPRRGWLATAVLVGLAFAGLAALAIAGLVAAGAPRADRELLAHEALVLVAEPYRAFSIAASARRAPFDWSTDGCSRTPAALARRFAGPCLQHDFAYRNLGGGLLLRADESTRRWVDARFLTELRRRCADLFAGLRLRLRACRASARAMWAAVRRFGPRWGTAARAAGTCGRVQGT